MPKWVWQKWLIKAVVVLCLPLLASCVPSSPGGIGGGSSSSPTECRDAALVEKEEDVAEEADAGHDANAEDNAADFDDKLTLLPLLGNDGKCTVNPAVWVRDCARMMFQTMRHQTLTCRPIASGVELVRPARADYYPEENIITTIQVKNTRWNGAARVIERVGDASVSRVPIFKIVTTENEDGTTENHCELDNRHVEVGGNFVFEKVVGFVVQTLLVTQPCAP